MSAAPESVVRGTVERDGGGFERKFVVVAVADGLGVKQKAIGNESLEV